MAQRAQERQGQLALSVWQRGEVVGLVHSRPLVSWIEEQMDLPLARRPLAL